MQVLDKLDIPFAVRAALEKHRLPVAGYTVNITFRSAVLSTPSGRPSWTSLLKLCLEAFGRLGARWMNLHPGHNAPLQAVGYVAERNLQSLRELELTSGDQVVLELGRLRTC